MLSQAIYYNKKIFSDDYIIRLDIPKEYKLEKNVLLCIHNTNDLIEYDIIYKNIINRINLHLFKLTFTSDLNNFYYHFIDPALVSNTIINKDTFDFLYSLINNQVLSNIIFVCKSGYYKNEYLCDNLINTNIIVIEIVNSTIINLIINNNITELNIDSDDFINKCDYLNEICIKNSIKILDSNFKSIIGNIYTNNKNWKITNNSFNIFINDSKKYFDNYIYYEIIGFSTKYIKLKTVDRQFIYQVLALINEGCSFLEYSNLELTKFKNNNIKNKIKYTILYDKNVSACSNKIIQILESIYYYLCDSFLVANSENLSNLQQQLFFKSLHLTPKFIKNKLFNTYISNINKFKNIDNNISININNVFLEKSLDQYVSLISLSNWKDEIEEKSCMGILANIICNTENILGYSSASINVKDVYNTLITYQQLSEAQLYYYDKHFFFDNGKHIENSINGTVIGNGNSIIPIYINSYHWESAIKLLEFAISISLTQNTYSFKKKMLDIYYHVLLKCTTKLIENSDYSDKSIITFISLFRTCYELNLGNNNDYKYFIEGDYLKMCYVHNIRVVYGSFILNHIKKPFSLDICKIFFIRIYEEIIRRYLKNNYNNICALFVASNKELHTLKNILIKFYESDLFKELEILFILSLSHITINDTLKQYDLQYGFLDDTNIKSIKDNFITIKKNNNKLIEFLNIPEDKLIFLIIQSFMTRITKIRKKSIINNKYIDIINSDSNIVAINTENLLFIINKENNLI